MKRKLIGAWVVHHSKKIKDVSGANQDYEGIDFAGKCGQLLSSIASTSENELSNTEVKALARANGISTLTELPTILNKLDELRLIDLGDSGIAILGLTTAQTLVHTCNIFKNSDPNKCELIAVDLAEKSSELPVLKKESASYISDQFKLSSGEVNEILTQQEYIGFIDNEDVGQDKLYFNGNLFRASDMRKIDAVLSSLAQQDENNLNELLSTLSNVGCMQKDNAIKITSKILYSKLVSIGFIDENSIGNEFGLHTFVTRPAAFNKFTETAIDDAFDLAKAFVTSLTYGMTSSHSGRGKITMITALMRRLINGETVGPATAIGNDYKILELKGVIKLKKAPHGMYYMRLLKKDVGQLALSVITEGEASTESLIELPSVAATQYSSPEQNRVIERKKQREPLKRGVSDLLNDLRTGGLR